MKEHEVQRPTVFYSNHYEALADLLKENLYIAGGNPLQRKLVILPSKTVKNDLFLRFNMVAGVKFLTLEQAVLYLASLTLGSKHNPPSKLLLALHLEQEILALDDPQLKEYLTQPLRARKLADHLIQEFLSYGKYGGAFLRSWLKKEGWQQSLWKKVFGFWNYPYQLLDEKIDLNQLPFQIDLHLFGIHFLPTLYQKFFAQFFGKWDFTAYQLSPCRFFWEDLKSKWEKGDEYSLEQNSLLANLGKLGRKGLAFYDQFQVEELYVRRDGSQLCRLQQEILELEAQDSQEQDHSIQLHLSPSKHREIQCLKETLLTLLAKGDVKPSEVLVLAPEIAEYAPLIHLEFSSLDYQIHNLEIESHFLQGVKHLLTLISSPWNVDEIIKLFANPCMQQRFGWSEKDYFQMRRWFLKTGVSWGYDLEHRVSFDSEDRSNEESGAGTFSDTIDRMLLGLAVNSPDSINVVETPQAELFGEVIECLETLKKDLTVFETEEYSFKEWIGMVKEWTRQLFFIEESQGSQLFDDALQQLASLPEAQVKFASIKHYLESALKKKIGVYAPSHVESIRFTSMKEGEITPAKVICMIGMDEESFPKRASQRSINEMKNSREKDLFPSNGEQDRYLFLEALLSCRETLIISSTTISSQDGKELSPSLLIDELGEITTIVHPSVPFEKATEPRGLIPTYAFPEENTFNDDVIDLMDLKKLARSPLRFYFNQAMGIYLKRSDPLDEEMILSYMKKAILRGESLTRPMEEVLKSAEVLSEIPAGPFQKTAIQRIEDEVNVMQDHLQAFGITQDEIFDIELKISCEKPHRQGNLWVYPALRVGDKIITGKLENVCQKGLLYYGEKKLPDLLKVWPLYLVFLSIMDGDLLLTKKGVRMGAPEGDPIEHLKAYLEYFEMAYSAPSPLEPEWSIGMLLKETAPMDLKDDYFIWAFQEKSHINVESAMRNWAPYLKRQFEPLLQWSAP